MKNLDIRIAVKDSGLTYKARLFYCITRKPSDLILIICRLRSMCGQVLA